MFEAHIITINPSFIENYKKFGPIRAAEQKKLATIEVRNLRDFAVDNHGSIDSPPYGGGDGMVMRPDSLAAALDSIPGKEKPHVLLTSPSGTLWRHQSCLKLAAIKKPVAIICGRFGGVDQRFIDMHVDQEVSLGDFVLSGGELAALTILDSTLRLIPGVLGNAQSAYFDSFAEGMEGQLEYPLYTKPNIFNGKAVPEILRSGNHKLIEQWRKEKSQQKTLKNRPDLITIT